MTKAELKVYTDYFGQLPLGNVKDQEVRLSIVKLYCELSKLLKPVTDEIELLRTTIVGEKQDEVNEYVLLKERGDEDSVLEAEGMTDCVRIEKDFQEATRRLYEEELPEGTVLPKIPLATLYDALLDCGFPKLSFNVGLSVIVQEFAPFIDT